MPEDFDNASESMDWKQYWQILCRRRWWLALPAFGVWAMMWIVAWFLPATYRSETVILVEQQKVPEQYVVSNVAADLQERLQSMTQQILSRTRLLAIIDEYKLYPSLQGRRTPDDLVERMRKDIQIELVQSPNQRGELTAFKVAYLSNDPHLAQRVTTQLTSLFINENVRARQEQSEQTTEFLDTELEEARRGLTEQETKVKEFKSQFLGQLPEQVQSNLQILSGLQTQLQQETDALSRAKQQSVYLESLLTQWRSFESDLQMGRSVGAVAPPALDQELQRLRAEFADLSSHYTEKHPDVRKVKDQIAKNERMKEQMEARVAAAAQGSTEGAPRPSSYADLQAMSPRMEVESQVKSNKLEIENRQRAIRDLQKQVDQYQGRLNMTPVREQQLAALTRDYEQSRKNYEELLAKRDQSERATNLEKRQQGEQFQVLDAPNVPQKPYSPNRLKLDLIGLVVGLVLGIISLAGSEVVDDTIYSREALERVFTGPVLAEIPPLPTKQEEQRAKQWVVVQLALISGMIVCTAAGFGITFLFG